MAPLLPLDITLPELGSQQRLRTLHRQLRSAIACGRLHPGLRLPASRALAAELGVSRNTVMAAYELLIDEGYLRAREGAGTFVTELLPRQTRKPPAAGKEPSSDARLQPFWRHRSVAPVEAIDAAPRFDFRLGVPDHRHFPVDVWRRLSARALHSAQKAPVAYDAPQGRLPLREAIAAHVSFARAVACGPDDIVITAGAQQAFDLLARILVTPGHTVVALENPGYPPLRNAFAAAGARLAPVPVDREGLRVDRLPDKAGVVCVTPSHQFPLGVALSTRRRVELLQFARARGAVVIEDDYDSEFRFDARPLDALKTLDGDGSVFYVGTFSKCLFPTIRIGYVVAPLWAQRALAAAKQGADWHNAVPVQDTLATFISEGHLARHVRRMGRLYAARRERLLEGLQRGFGEWLEPIAPAAGLHLAAPCRPGVDADAVAQRAQQHGIAIQSMRPHGWGRSNPAGLMFGYGAIDEAVIGEALQLLRQLMPAPSD